MTFSSDVPVPCTWSRIDSRNAETYPAEPGCDAAYASCTRASPPTPSSISVNSASFVASSCVEDHDIASAER